MDISFPVSLRVILRNKQQSVLFSIYSFFYHIGLFPLYSSVFNKKIWKIFPKTVSISLSVQSLFPCEGKSCIFWASGHNGSQLHAFMYKSKSVQIFWIILPVKEQQPRGAGQCSSLWHVCQDAEWTPFADHTVLNPVHHWESLASYWHSSVLPPSHMTYLCLVKNKSCEWEWDLQCCVDVHKDDDYQVEDGPNDAQHGQDGLLFTLLVLDSLFLITVGSVYHFPWKSLQFSSQTNLEWADKTENPQSHVSQLQMAHSSFDCVHCTVCGGER